MVRPPGELRRLQEKPERLVAGLISGTSADGVDCAVTRISGTSAHLSVEMLSFVSVPYPDDLRKMVLKNSDASTSSVKDLSQLNFRLAFEFASTTRRACAQAGVEATDLDIVGSHGQTLHHVPDPEDLAGVPTRSTLQIGDPSVLANLLGVTVVGDFRVADMAHGGQGAPLVPYGDYALFRNPDIDRILLNLGGIANITVLAAGADPETIVAFDTGPANMIIDELAQRLFNVPYDDGGRIAQSGRVRESLLEELLRDPYYERRPPKSTGRERFGARYVDDLIVRAEVLQCSGNDLMTTAAELTARSVSDAVIRFTRVGEKNFQLVVGGGGAHNEYVMSRFRALLPHGAVVTTEAFGIIPDAREAVCFAVLAHETLNERAGAIASVTGASVSAILGKICLPTRIQNK